jgi:hypothetical protein
MAAAVASKTQDTMHPGAKYPHPNPQPARLSWPLAAKEDRSCSTGC